MGLVHSRLLNCGFANWSCQTNQLTQCTFHSARSVKRILSSSPNFFFVLFLVWIARWIYWNDFSSLGVVLVHTKDGHRKSPDLPRMALDHFVCTYSASAATSLPPSNYCLPPRRHSCWTEQLIQREPDFGWGQSSFLAWSPVDLHTENTDLQGRRELSKSWCHLPGSLNPMREETEVPGPKWNLRVWFLTPPWKYSTAEGREVGMWCFDIFRAPEETGSYVVWSGEALNPIRCKQESSLFMKPSAWNLDSDQVWPAMMRQGHLMRKQGSSTSHSAKTAGLNQPAL